MKLKAASSATWWTNDHLTCWGQVGIWPGGCTSEKSGCYVLCDSRRSGEKNDKFMNFSWIFIKRVFPFQELKVNEFDQKFVNWKAHELLVHCT